jgi:Tol biopolymer transport system component
MEEKCAQFVGDTPSSFFDGTIVLDSYKREERAPIYFLDIKTNDQVALNPGIDATLSPDGNMVAYSDVDLDVVAIANVTGIFMQIPEEPDESLIPAGWLDNQRLMLDRYQWDSNMKTSIVAMSLVVLDLVTGEKEEWFQEYPNFNDFYNEVFWTPASRLLINPNLDYLIYPAREDGLPVILWDINSDREVARVHNGDRDSTPRWSPDGTRFAIRASPQIEEYKNIDDGLPNTMGGYDLFLVNTTGKIERLTYFNTTDKSLQTLYSWSPNGQYIVFLLQTGDFGAWDAGDVAIVNVNTGEVTQFCIGGIPIWTSDGGYILLSQTDDNWKKTVYLLDPQSSKAFLIAEDAVAIGGTIRSP